MAYLRMEGSSRAGPGGHFSPETSNGKQGMADFFVMNDLGITIAGQSFPHRIFHFALAFFDWEYADLVLGGESLTMFRPVGSGEVPVHTLTADNSKEFRDHIREAKALKHSSFSPDLIIPRNVG